MRTITLTLTQHPDEVVTISAKVVPSIPWTEAMHHPVQRVAKAMLDHATDRFGIIADIQRGEPKPPTLMELLERDLELSKLKLQNKIEIAIAEAKQQGDAQAKV